MGTPGTVLITGTTSGVGLNAAKALVDRGWTVITANRSPQRAAGAADQLEIPKDRLQHVLMDLGDLDSVRSAVEKLPSGVDALVCNAAVYKPKLKQPERSPQGYEISMATNHFGHFLLVQLLLDRIKASSHPSRRVVILGTVTANSKELGGKIPIPAPADLGDLSGFEAGFLEPVSMASGKPFKPGKAYKDSKLCNMLFSYELERRLQASGSKVTVNAFGPGLITRTGLFRHQQPLFVKAFDLITNTFNVAESVDGGGNTLLYMLTDESLEGVGGAYYSNTISPGSSPTGHAFIVQESSEESKDVTEARNLWRLSEKLVGLA